MIRRKVQAMTATRGGPIRRSPIKRTSWHRKPIDKEARAVRREKARAYGELSCAVLERDGFACRYCKRTQTWPPIVPHHIIFRSQGGKDTMENLISLCGEDHALIHARKLWIIGDANTAIFTTENPKGVK